VDTQIKRLRDSLSSSQHFVESVDHPVVLEGPDVLIGGEGRLVCLYLSKRRSVIDLLARVAASKLAFPSHCMHVLVVEQKAVGKMGVDTDPEAFDKVVELSDVTRPSLLREKPSERVSAGLARVKKQQSLLYARTFQFASSRQKYQVNDGSSSRIARLLHQGEKRTAILDYKGIDLFARDVPVTLRHIKHLCRVRFSEYTFDRNIPYPKKLIPGIALADRVPGVRGDPEKPLRAAAFSGWIVADASSTDELDAIIERARRFGFEML
jgi:hypothetical protein